ncbi:MAG: hypothetical protein R3B90_13745 [Planctomycetaceae bacterium]
MVVNRFSKITGNPSVADIERSLRHSVDFQLPFDRRAVTAANIGRPFALSPRWFSGLERGLKGIVQEIESIGGPRERETTSEVRQINGSSPSSAHLSRGES